MKIFEHLIKLFPIKKKELEKLGPGESFRVKVPVPTDATEGVISLRYADEFGNEYETRATFSLKERKIIKQDYKIIKKVKELPDIPKLEINEESISWPDL